MYVLCYGFVVVGSIMLYNAPRRERETANDTILATVGDACGPVLAIVDDVCGPSGATCLYWHVLAVYDQENNVCNQELNRRLTAFYTYSTVHTEYF